jgi:hypothetical protein
MARSYLAILKDKRKRVPFLRERKREEPLPKKEKEWGARESGKKPWLRSSLFIARSPPHFFPRRFVFRFSFLSASLVFLHSPASIHCLFLFDLLHESSKRRANGAESETETRKERAGSKKRERKISHSISLWPNFFRLRNLEEQTRPRKPTKQCGSSGARGCPRARPGTGGGPRARGRSSRKDGFPFMLDEEGEESGRVKKNSTSKPPPKKKNQPLPVRSHQPHGRRPPAPRELDARLLQGHHLARI